MLKPYIYDLSCLLPFLSHYCESRVHKWPRSPFVLLNEKSFVLKSFIDHNFWTAYWISMIWSIITLFSVSSTLSYEQDHMFKQKGIVKYYGSFQTLTLVLRALPESLPIHSEGATGALTGALGRHWYEANTVSTADVVPLLAPVAHRRKF